MEPSRRLAAALEPVIGAVYFAPECHAAYEELGHARSGGTFGGVEGPDMTAYFCSRGSLLGQVPGAVVASAFAVFNPELVIPVVDRGWAIADAAHMGVARLNGIAAALERVLGPADQTVAHTADLLERAGAELPLPGRPLFAGVRAAPAGAGEWHRFHRAGDALREYRGDCHTIAWAGAGLSACEIGLMSESYWGLPLRSYSRTRAWSDTDYDAAGHRLHSLGWIDDAGLTELGRAERERIETLTDELCAPLVAALGDDLEVVVERLGSWSRAIIDANCYPGSGPHDLAAANA